MKGFEVKFGWLPGEESGILDFWEEYKTTRDAPGFLEPCDVGIRRAAEQWAGRWGVDADDLYGFIQDDFLHRLEGVGVSVCSSAKHLLARLAKFVGFSVMRAGEKFKKHREREEPLTNDDYWGAVTDELPDSILDEERAAIGSALIGCIRKLSALEYAVVRWSVLHHEELTQKEVGERAGVSDRYVRKLLRRALNKLKHCYEDKRAPKRWMTTQS